MSLQHVISLGEWRDPNPAPGSGAPGGDYHVEATIDEARLAPAAQRAVARRDKRVRLAGGAVLIRATPLPPTPEGDEPC